MILTVTINTCMAYVQVISSFCGTRALDRASQQLAFAMQAFVN
jgi:hypothetical protein